MQRKTVEVRDVDAVHDAIAVIDAHVDIAPNYATPMLDPGYRTREQADLVSLAEGGVDGAFLIVYVPQRNRNPASYRRARTEAERKFAAIHRLAELHPRRAGVARTAQEFEDLRAEGRFAALIGIENGYVIGRDLALLRQYAGLGARYMTLAHNGHNDICDSAVASAELGDDGACHGGLSDFGRDVVREMNALGMIVDVSHISPAAMLEAARLSRAPVIASHSGARALVDHPRNLDDDQLRAVRDSGGVVHLTAVDPFVCQRSAGYVSEATAVRARFGVLEWHGERKAPPEIAMAVDEALAAEIENRWPRATLAQFVDHIDHAVRVIGEDHVGIASDFDGGGGVAGWMDASQTRAVTAELMARGYGVDALRKIWGDNLLRVMRAAERVAQGQ